MANVAKIHIFLKLKNLKCAYSTHFQEFIAVKPLDRDINMWHSSLESVSFSVLSVGGSSDK